MGLAENNQTSGGETDERTRVLLVDDEESIRKALTRGLSRFGCHVMESEGGEHGLELAASFDPDVVFLDLRMPGIDGHTFLRRLPSVNPHSAVVVMSGHGGMEDVVDVLRGGAVDYLKKPWSPTDLAAALSRAVDAATMRRTHGKAGQVPEAPKSRVGSAQEPDRSEPASMAKILEKVKSGELSVPAVSSVLARVRALLMGGNTDLDALVGEVEKDQRLVADLVRTSNSVQYSRGGRNNSVRLAITRLGFRQVHTRVETLILKGLYPSRNPAATKVLATLWRQSVAEALSMRAIADILSASDDVNPDVAYLVGLFNDVGASFLVWILAERDPKFVDDAGLKETLSRFHQEMSGLVLERWNFDKGIVNLVRTHHNESPPSDNIVYWEMSILARDLARKITGSPDAVTGKAENPTLVERCASSLQIGDRTISKIIGPLKSEFETFMEEHA